MAAAPLPRNLQQTVNDAYAACVVAPNEDGALPPYDASQHLRSYGLRLDDTILFDRVAAEAQRGVVRGALTALMSEENIRREVRVARLTDMPLDGTGEQWGEQRDALQLATLAHALEMAGWRPYPGTGGVGMAVIPTPGREPDAYNQLPWTDGSDL